MRTRAHYEKLFAAYPDVVTLPEFQAMLGGIGDSTARKIMRANTTRDQRMMFAVITLIHMADTKEQLDSDTEAILATARKQMCQLATMKYQQLDGLNTVLPIGLRKINAMRTLTTESLAVFMPFKVQEIQEVGGIFFGENAISHNLILCNMATF